MKKISMSERLFKIFNYFLLCSVGILCILPIVNLFSISLSASHAADAGFVKLWPVEFTLDAYKYVLKKVEFINAMIISLKRVGLGVLINLLLTSLMAYPLSKSKNAFSSRNVYANILLVSMIFGGGLIPTYLVVKQTGLIDTIWALILPGAVPVYSVILLQNFFKGIPSELEDAAFIDGAGIWRTLFTIYMPLSKPALATLALFATVGHWNSWFDGIIYMNRAEHYPLQTYLQTMVINNDITANKSTEEILELMNVSQRNTKAAQIFVAMVPILMVYPFLQKYFTTGIVLGSVKG